MIRHLLSLLVITAFPATIIAQNGLRDIPDPDPVVQQNAFKLMPGAKINLFASEPAVANPIHMNWDQRGRLWVVTSPLYPQLKPGDAETDKIIILEDADNDGVAEKQTVFADNLHIPTAILPMDNGVFVANSTEVLFLQDTDGDDVADTREVVMSGFGTEDTHHLIHTFHMGPEGMLWMNQSIYIHTHLETPYGVRRLLGGGMWHFNVDTQRAEVYMKGLVNPWGHTFDEWGQSFMTDGAGGQGINYVFPRSVFATSPGASRILSGLNPGQPKHCGLEIMTGRHLPDELQGVLATADFRGSRINLFRLSENGSSYTSTQMQDLLSSTHRAFRPIDIKMGPDGAIYVADWYNPIIQHGEVDFRDPRRDHEHGRIWRITFDEKPLVAKPDLTKLSDQELVSALHAPEGWTRKQATAELRTRDRDRLAKAIADAVPPENVDHDLFRLRKLWASQAVNRPDHAMIRDLIKSGNHKARAAGLRAIYYNASNFEGALEIATDAVSDPHPQVRLWAVSVLAQLPDRNTVDIALQALEGIKVDRFLDFAVWSICREHSNRWIPRAEKANPFDSMDQLLFAAQAVKRPIGVRSILTGLAEGKFNSEDQMRQITDFVSKVGSAGDLASLFEFAIDSNTSDQNRKLIFDALQNASRLRKLRPSGDLSRIEDFLASDDSELYAKTTMLVGLWDVNHLLPNLEQRLREIEVNPGKAQAAFNGLISFPNQKAGAIFDNILGDPNAAFRLRSLAAVGRIKISPVPGAQMAIQVLRSDPTGDDPHGVFDAILANRKATQAFTKALEGQDLPKTIGLTGIKKANNASSKQNALIAAIQSAADIKPMKASLTNAELVAMVNRVAESGDPHKGEAIYRRAKLQCISCHAIGGAGSVVGPDLVSIGASAPIDYLIESMLLPNKKIKEGYHTTLVSTLDGELIAGAVVKEDENELVLRDAKGKENRIAKDDIEMRKVSDVSMMPADLTAELREDEFVDLIRFLSELGQEGEFKTTPNRFIRHWQFLQPHERTRDAIGHYGNVIFAEDFDTYVWSTSFSKVDGSLPMSESPEVLGRGRNRFAVARSFIDVPQAGNVRIRVSGKLKDMSLFLGETEISLPKDDNQAEIVLNIKKSGKQKLTLCGLKHWGLDGVSLELLDDASIAKPIEAKDFDN